MKHMMYVYFSSELIVENAPYFILKIVLKDIYVNSIKTHLEEFFLFDIVPIPYRERFKRIVDYYLGCIFVF